MALLRFSLIKFTVVNCSAGLICKAKSSHITPLRSPLATNQQPDSVQNNSQLLPHSLVQLPHTWVASFLFSFLLFLDTILCCSGGQEDPWGERSFQYTGPVIWNSLPLAVSICLHSLHLSQNWKPTFSLVHTDLWFSFFSFCQPNTSNACICSVCVCVCVCVFVCVCVCVCSCACERMRDVLQLIFLQFSFISLIQLNSSSNHREALYVF